VLALLASGCGVLARDAYVRENERLLASLPTYPGAQLIRKESSADYETDSDGERISPLPRAYTTRAVYRLPSGTRAAAVFAFYRHVLRGWRVHMERSIVLDPTWTPRPGEIDSITFTRGSRSVAINTVRGSRFALLIDYGRPHG